MAAGQLTLICAADALLDGGTGVRFELSYGGQPCSAFAIRHAGRVSAYLNRCAHVGVELDWQPGVFLDTSATFIVCAMHGAIYAPSDGRCAGGPCAGRGGLRALGVVEEGGQVYWIGEPQLDAIADGGVTAPAVPTPPPNPAAG